MTPKPDSTPAPARVSVGEFLKRPNIWRIPVYQRHYSWEIKEHGPVMQFWESVRDRAFGELDEEQNPTHYLGALLLDYHGEDQSGRHRYDVVDGQQRITTIQLALCALVCVATEGGVEAEIQDIFKYISYEDSSGKSCPTLHPANFDKKQFEIVLFDTLRRSINPKGDYSRNEENWDKPKVYDTFKFFCKEIEIVLEGEDNIKSRKVKYIKNTLLYGFEIVLITLKKFDKAQKIFESMNSTAKPLTTFDLIRNDVFYRTSQKGEDDEALFNSDEWQEFEKPFWEKKSSQRSTSTPHIDDYIARMLIAKRRESVKFDKSDLYRTYKEFGVKYTDTRKEVKSISEYIDIYKYLVREHDDAPKDVKCLFFREWKNKSFYSLIFVILNSQIDFHEKKRMIALLESYVVRRSICGLASEGYNKTALEILKTQDQINFDNLHEFLCLQTAETSIFPNDSKLKQDIRHARFYQDKHKIQNYILQEIELSLRTNQDEEIKFSDLTLDHIMPQTRNTNDGWASDDDDEAMAEDYIHTIGNITLLTRAKNSSISNKSFNKIKEKLSESSLLMNREIVKQVDKQDAEPNTNRKGWNLDSIKARSDVLADMVCKRWPHDVFI